MSVLKSEMRIVGDRMEKAETTIREAVDRHRAGGDSEVVAMQKAYYEPQVVAARVELQKIDLEALHLIDAADSAAHARERVQKGEAEAVEDREIVAVVERLRKADPDLTEAAATVAAFRSAEFGRVRRALRERAA